MGCPPLAWGQASSLQQRDPQVPAGSPATRRGLYELCPHILCRQICFQCQASRHPRQDPVSSPCPPGSGGGGEETWPSLGSHSLPPSPHAWNSKHKRKAPAAPAALLSEKRCDQGAEGSDGAPGGSGWVEKPHKAVVNLGCPNSMGRGGRSLDGD